MATRKVSVREARRHFRLLLDQIQAGDEVLVLRRGIEVGRIVRPEQKKAPLPDLSAFRASIRLRGKPLSQEIAEARKRSRY